MKTPFFLLSIQESHSIVYYVQLVATICLLGVMLKLGWDFLVLGLKITTGTIGKKDAMQQSFTIFFGFFLAMFVTGIIWMDKSEMALLEIVSFITIAISVSFFISFFFALGVYATTRS